MAYNPNLPAGQAAMSASNPVTIASDQSAVPVSGTVAVTSATLATSAKQDTGNTSLSSIDGKLPALGQALEAGSVPVVLPAAQISTLTPPAAITGYATSAAQTDKSQFTKITDGTDTALVTASGEQNVLESNSASSLTSLQLIDDTVVAQGTALGTTKNSMVGGSVTTAAPTYTTGQISPLSLATTGALRVDLSSTAANTTAVKVNVASGGIASGGIASGALASGSVASGAIAAGSVAAGALVSGSVLSGALASGAVVDITNVSTPITPATATATKAINLGAEYRSTLPTWTNAQQGALQVGTRGALHVELWNSDSATVNPVGSGTATGALRVELANNGTGLVGLNAGTNAIGKLTSNSGVTIGAVELVAAQTLATVTTLTTLTGGGVAHDGVDSGNPIKIGARAINAEIAAVANNDRSDLVTTLTGKLIVATNTNPENIVSGVTSAMTGTTSTSVVAAPAAGLRNYITQITVGNSHATVGTFVNIQDGSGGTTIWTIPAAAVYGGATINFDPPLRQPTTATALYCACVTTGSNTIVAANGFKAA